MIPRTAALELNGSDVFVGAQELAVLTLCAQQVAPGRWAWRRPIGGGMAGERQPVRREAVRLHPGPMLDEVRRDPAILDGLPLDVLIELERQVGHVGVDVQAAIGRQTADRGVISATDPDRAVRIEEAGTLLGMSKDYLYR